MKILIAYYSKTGQTEKLALAIKEEFTKKHHQVDIEKIEPIKEHSFFGWWHLRIVRGSCEIKPLKIQEATPYDVVCIGSPNWTRLSLPVAGYLKIIKGLEYKNIGFFATTAAWPAFEWYVLSAHLLDFTFSRAVEKKEGRLVANLLLSSRFKKRNFSSAYGKRVTKAFCQRLEQPIYSLKNYLLKQKIVKELRFLIVVFSFILFVLLLFQALALTCPVRNLVSNGACFRHFLSLSDFLSFFFVTFFAYFMLITSLAANLLLSEARYFASLAVIFMFTMALMFFQPGFLAASQGILILCYIFFVILFSFFREAKIIFFTGLMTLFSYGYLFFSYPLKEIFRLSTDLPLLLLSLFVVIANTESWQNHYLRFLRAQEAIELAKRILEIKVRARTREFEEMNRNLENIVEERTKELKERLDELEKINRVTIGRELKMIELKKEIKKLKERS